MHLPIGSLVCQVLERGVPQYRTGSTASRVYAGRELDTRQLEELLPRPANLFLHQTEAAKRPGLPIHARLAASPCYVRTGHFSVSTCPGGERFRIRASFIVEFYAGLFVCIDIGCTDREVLARFRGQASVRAYAAHGEAPITRSPSQRSFMLTPRSSAAC